jgi:NADH dehydrogenase FAD-containing subunit
VLTNSAVERIDDEGVVVAGRRVAARNVFWAAGVMASPAAQWLKTEADRAGRVKVAEDLSVPGLPGIFVIGDTALSNGWDGKPVPGLADVLLRGPWPVPFEFRGARRRARAAGATASRRLQSRA